MADAEPAAENADSGSFVDRALNQRCVDWLALAGSARVLDVGCGFGGLTRAPSAGAVIGDRTSIGGNPGRGEPSGGR